ncbi:hypothetical protein LXL04_000655 [Taraxacum kok-saghyz]
MGFLKICPDPTLFPQATATETVITTVSLSGITIVVVINFPLNSVVVSGGMTEQKIVQRQKKTLAKWLKESILILGLTFIKIGQQFSTKVDILAQKYTDISIIEEELGAPDNEVFDFFYFEPIVAASLRNQPKCKILHLQLHIPSLKLPNWVLIESDRDGTWNWQTIVIGASFLAFLLSAKHLDKKNKKLFWVFAIAPLISVIFSTLFVYITHAQKQESLVEIIGGGMGVSGGGGGVKWLWTSVVGESRSRVGCRGGYGYGVPNI